MTVASRHASGTDLESRLITPAEEVYVPEDGHHMSLKRTSEDGVLHTVAGITGVGWTGSVLGYLGTAVGYGSPGNPQSFLYLGGVLFVATVGLDRLRGCCRSENGRTDRKNGHAGRGTIHLRTPHQNRVWTEPPLGAVRPPKRPST